MWGKYGPSHRAVRRAQGEEVLGLLQLSGVPVYKKYRREEDMKNLESDQLFKIIGSNVKYYRKLYNLTKGKMTQENLAELVDVSTALIGNLESDKISQGISVLTLWKISKTLEISVEDLFDDTKFRKKSI